MNQVVRETVLPAPADEVWELVSDPESLSDWFGAAIDGRIDVGEVVTFRHPDGSESRALIEIAEERRRLVFRWLPHERGPDGRVRRRESSRVVIDLEPCTDGTLVRVTETRVGSAGTPLPEIGFRPLAEARR